MSKDTFLQELRGYLQILEDQEQQDILDEYTQHIDMKIQKGLSEEEAIRDFGPVRELAAGILEAYHVKPDFKPAKPKLKAPDLTKAAETGKKAWENAGIFLRQQTASAGSGLKKAGVSIRKAFAGLGESLKKIGSGWNGLFRRNIHEDRTQDNSGVRVTQNPARQVKERGSKADGMSNIWTVMGRGAKKMWNGLVTFCKWTLRMVWNVFWLCASGVSGFFAMAALFGLGSMVILRMQGYPLTGIVVLCLGCLLIFGAVSGGCFSLIIRKETAVTAESESAALEEEDTDEGTEEKFETAEQEEEVSYE